MFVAARTSTCTCSPTASRRSPRFWTKRGSPTRSSANGSESTARSASFVHIHVDDRFPFELTIYASDKAHYVFKSSITGKAIERASIAELEQLLAREYPDVSLEQSVLEAESRVDRFQIYEMLLLPLENVKENPKYHPEGDALYHSLQVFELARAELPYDEEFLLAALLHDVGKAIDRHDHVAAGLEALAGYITPRIAWFIEHHMEGQELLDGSLGVPCPAATGSVRRL